MTERRFTEEDSIRANPFIQDKFVVTGVDRSGKRFRRYYQATSAGAIRAFGINLWRGSVWHQDARTGKRTLLKRVYN